MTDILLSKDEGEVITLTLNDAPANTLSMEMIDYRLIVPATLLYAN